MSAHRPDETVRPSGKLERSVLFLVNSLQVGGSERKAVRLANALAAGGCQVTVAYLNPPESLLSQVHSAVPTLNLQRRGKFSIKSLRQLGEIIRERKISTLVAINLYSALYAVLASSLGTNQGVRVVVSVNTTEFATLKEQLEMLLYRHILRRADLIVFGAERQRRLWCARYGLDCTPDRTMVLYNGVDTFEFSRAGVERATLGVPANRVMLGTVGAFRIGKAQVDLVRTVHGLTTRGVDVGAIIVGDGPQRAEIEGEIRRLGVEPRVVLVGEAHDVRPYLAAMEIFVLPSVAVETFSNAVLEAMAMSCPVLAARVGGMEEMLRFGGGMTYPPGDVESLCQLLMPLVVNASARKALGEQACRVVATHFSFDRMLSDFRTHVLNIR
jgi:glycosyltransferase involved in cell wall biosynthesis